MKFADRTGVTELITLTKTALKPLEAFKNSVTDVNGIVKSNGSGGFSAAVAGTDYAAANHTHTTEQVEGLSTAIEEVKPFIINVTGWTFGTGSLDVVQVKNGRLVDNDMGEMAAFVLMDGKWHEVKKNKVL